MKKLILFVFCTILYCGKNPAQVVYVDGNASGGNNGSSWADAFTKLQAGIDAGLNGKQVWVAAGIYPPTGFSFEMRNGVEIYGGFSGSETTLNQRDWNANVTTMKGDGSHAVIFNYSNSNNPMDGSAILDGFTITNGKSNSSSTSYPDGGGIYNNAASPTLRNLIITGNSASDKGGGIYGIACGSILENVTVSNNNATMGGGIYFDEGDVTTGNFVYPSLKNIVVESNTASGHGGGIYLYESDVKIVGSVIRNNKASYNNGGGIYFTGGGLDYFGMVNCLVTDNEAGIGGGIYLDGGGSVKFQNITVSNNNATNSTAGGIALQSAGLEMSNSIVFGNKKISGAPANYNPDLSVDGNFYPTINFCVISGYGSVSNNFEVDPAFMDPDNGDYHLAGNSPLINLGSNALYTSAETLDLDNNPRIFNNTIDIGAYEFQGYVSVKKEVGTGLARIYPNPANHRVTIDLSQPAAFLDITVTDVTGKLLLRRKTTGTMRETINVDGWTPGVYFVKTVSPEWQISNKLLVTE